MSFLDVFTEKRVAPFTRKKESPTDYMENYLREQPEKTAIIRIVGNTFLCASF